MPMLPGPHPSRKVQDDDDPARGTLSKALLVEAQLKKPLADAILFCDLEDAGSARVERKGRGWRSPPRRNNPKPRLTPDRSGHAQT